MTIMMYVPEIWNKIDVTFCHFGLFFTLLPPTKPPKKSKLKKTQKMLKDIILYHFIPSVPKIMNTCHIVLEIWCMTDVIVIFDFGLFFTLLPP